MGIQILLIGSILVLGFLLLRKPGSDTHQALRRMLFAAFALVAILSVLFPQWLTWVAQLMGVGRGTDLLLYALVVVFLAFVYAQYRANAGLQRQLTRLARRFAIQEALLAEARQLHTDGEGAPGSTSDSSAGPSPEFRALQNRTALDDDRGEGPTV